MQYPKVIEMLSAVEALFKDIESLPSASAEAGTRIPVSFFFFFPVFVWWNYPTRTVTLCTSKVMFVLVRMEYKRNNHETDFSLFKKESHDLFVAMAEDAWAAF